ncbi:hypothetical protein M3221_10860 [Domibacillus indicus]|nr:hypothetical protein [Domibacillus indicus]MCM3788906.1 hypothetical protein [Domibacillus indicus]
MKRISLAMLFGLAGISGAILRSQEKDQGAREARKVETSCVSGEKSRVY